MAEKELFTNILRRGLQKARKHREPYTTPIRGESFLVHPNVFSPKYFGSTEFLIDNLRVKPGDEVLEIGTGTGAVAVFIAKQEAGHVVATDISEDAVRNAEANIKKHRLQGIIEVRTGSVYGPVRHETFDKIYWNAPFGYTEKTLDVVEKQLFDQNYEAIKTFLEGLSDHLNPGGKAYLTMSLELGEETIVIEHAENHGLEVAVLAEETQLRENQEVTMHLLELKEPLQI